MFTSIPTNCFMTWQNRWLCLRKKTLINYITFCFIKCYANFHEQCKIEEFHIILNASNLYFFQCFEQFLSFHEYLCRNPKILWLAISNSAKRYPTTPAWPERNLCCRLTLTINAIVIYVTDYQSVLSIIRYHAISNNTIA